MPIGYELTLGDSITAGTELTFTAWIEDVWDCYHETSVAFAILEGPEGIGKAYTNGICALLEHADLTAGNTMTGTTVLGRAAADGESIPYGKSYSVFRYET